MSDIHSLALNGDATGILELIQHTRCNPVQLVNSYAYGRTPLHLAAQRGHHDATRALILCRADVNSAEANNGETPLHIACSNGHTSVAMLLCDRGAHINHPDGRYSWTALHHACERGDLSTACALLDREQRCVDGHCVIDSKDRDGFTALHHALINGFPDVAQALLSRGANPQIQAENGWNAMHCAARRGLQQVCLNLIRTGAVTLSMRDKDGNTALQIAHPTRINCDELEEASVNYWRSMRRTEKEQKDIAEGKVLCISPPKKADNKYGKEPSSVRKSVWAEEIDLSVPPDEFDDAQDSTKPGPKMADMAADVMAMNRALKTVLKMDAAKKQAREQKPKTVELPASALKPILRVAKPIVSPTFRARAGGKKGM